VPCPIVFTKHSHMQRTHLRLRLGAAAALAATAAIGLHSQQQSATALVDKADPTKSFAASSQPAVGDLFPVSETLFVDTSKKRVAIGRTSADTSLHVQGNMRITWNGLVNENIGSGSLQMTNFNYDRGWSGDQFGFQPYGGPLQLDRLAKSGVDASNTLYVRPGGLVGIGVPNPAMQLDVKGVVRASDTIVSTKPAGAPFVIASTDVTKNLNADLLDGKSAEEFATAAEVAALSAAVAAAGSTGGSTTTVASLMDNGRLILPQKSGDVFDGHNGIVFPDGTLQTTAYDPVSAPSAGPIGTLLSINGSANVSASDIVALDIEVIRYGVARIRARVTKPLDELSGHLFVDLMQWQGSYTDAEGMFHLNEVLGDLVLTLPTLPVQPSGAAIAQGARLILQNPRVIAIRQRPSKSMGFKNSVHSTPTPFALEEIELHATDLRIESLDGSTVYAEGGSMNKPIPSAVADAFVVQLSTSASLGGKLSTASTPLLRSIDYTLDLDSTEDLLQSHSIVYDAGGLAEKTLIGPRLEFGIVHPLLMTSAALMTTQVSWHAPLKRVVATVPMYSGGVNTPVHEIEMENVYARTWRLRNGAHGGFHIEVELLSDRQVRRYSAPNGEVQTVTVEVHGGHPKITVGG